MIVTYFKVDLIIQPFDQRQQNHDNLMIYGDLTMIRNDYLQNISLGSDQYSSFAGK
jgi:hypothetical protein